MNRPHRRAVTAKTSSNVHQTRAVTSTDALGSGCSDRRQLLVEHRARDVSVLDGEGATETTTLFRVGKSDELEPRDRAKEPLRRVTDPEEPQRMAGRMVGNRALIRRTDILYPENSRKKLREFPGSSGQTTVVPSEQ